MAIDKLTIPTPTSPGSLTDYQAILTQLVANGQAFTGRLIVQGSTIKAGTVILIGGVLYKAISDTAISGSASNYVKITPSGDTLTATASFVANLTGVTWNYAHGGYYDGGSPDSLYVFDEDIALAIGQVTGIPKTFKGIAAPPAGTVAIWSIATMPSGWLECNGQSVLRATYPRLFATIGTTYGSVDGTHFTVPDLRSATVRGVGTPTRFANSTAVTLNQTIDDKIEIHTHGYSYDKPNGGASGPFSGSGLYNFVTQNLTTGGHSGRSGSETTGKAVGMYYMIKA